MSSTNRGSVRPAGDFYETPAWATNAILPHLPLTNAVLDPCCGRGAILRCVAQLLGRECCDGIELDRELAAEAARYGDVMVTDALATPWLPCGTVLMNPPFSQALPFVIKAIEETRANNGTVAALMRLGMMASQGRAAFWRRNPCDVYVLPRRPSFTPDGKTDSADYAWFVWGPGRRGNWSVLDLAAARPLDGADALYTPHREDGA